MMYIKKLTWIVSPSFTSETLIIDSEGKKAVEKSP